MPEHDPASPDLPQGWAAEPIDPDTAPVPWPPDTTKTSQQEQREILVAIAVGGVIGAAARYGAGLLWPTVSGHFPWTTFWINIIGCALMGVLMVLVTERYQAPPLTRPFLGTGVLGGFTTFSTYAVDTQHLLHPATATTALLYAAGTLLGAIAAVWTGATLTRVATTRGAQR